MRKNLLIIIMMLMVSVGYSQAPGIFNYQGVARNSVGNVLVNKAITLRLTIHDGAAAGAIVYQESRGVITNPFGLFNVQVGSPGASTVTGTIATVPWGTGSKFIQVEIDPNGGTSFINIGTAQIASVPYSLYANLAGDLVLPFNKTQVDAGTLFKITNSGTGAGSTSLEGLTNSQAGNVSAIIGTITSASPGGFSAGVKGINNGTGGLGIGVWGTHAGSGWGVYGTAVGGIGVNGSASSGIGVNGTSNTGTGGRFTTTSGLALHTTGAVRLQGINEANNRILASDAAGNATWKDPSAVGIVTGNGTLNFIPKWTPNGTNLGNSKIFDDGNFVGIGTTTPGAGLVVSGAGIWNSAVGIQNTSSGMEWRMNVNGTSFGITKIPGSTFTPFQLFSTGGMDFSNSSGVSIMRLLDNGNVGIGTTAPASKLHVAGAVRIVDGTEGLNKILTSDAAGNASWQVPAPATDLVLPFNKTQADAGFLFKLTNSGNGSAIEAVTNSTLANAYGISGTVTPTHPGFRSAGVRGINNGLDLTGIGVYGSQAGGGFGVLGTTPNGYGVYGSATDFGTGVYAFSDSGKGFEARSTNGRTAVMYNNNAANANNVLDVANDGDGTTIRAVNSLSTAANMSVIKAELGNTSPGAFSAAIRGINYGTGGAGIGVEGSHKGNGLGVYGLTRGGIGVLGYSNEYGTGVAARSVSGTGLVATSEQGQAAMIQIANLANSNPALQVTTFGVGDAIIAEAYTGNVITAKNMGTGNGIFASSVGGYGVWGVAESSFKSAIFGRHTGGGEGVFGSTNSTTAAGVAGRNDGPYAGVYGWNTNRDGIGVLAEVRSNIANTSIPLVANNRQDGILGQIAVFQSSNTTVARIDRTGKGFFNGGTQVGGADVAEMFDAEGDRNEYEAGDVLIISRNSDRKIEKSSAPYSTLVAGVFATKPGVILTERNAEQNQVDDLVPMGVIGVIPTKVCIEGGAIRRGDLLVTSSIPGVAMKADPDKVKVGQVLGKALQDYNEVETGKINVLVSVK